MTRGTASEMAAARRWAAMFDAGEAALFVPLRQPSRGRSDPDLAVREGLATGGLPADGTHRELP